MVTIDINCITLADGYIMTPTLMGRWQTRFFLFSTVGLLVTVPFFLINPASLRILIVLLIFGFIWDILYHILQQFRWDRDWPAAFQLLAGIAEGMLIVVLLPIQVIPLFLVHYVLAWTGMFIASQSLMRILFPRLRFRGGQFHW